MRRLICLLLLVCLPLQSFAMQFGSPYTGAMEFSVAHESAHEDGTEHHHDADGSVHYDHSDESARHIHDHSSSPQVAFLTAPLAALAPQPASRAIDDTVARFIPDPFLDSPLRPPAHALG